MLYCQKAGILQSLSDYASDLSRALHCQLLRAISVLSVLAFGMAFEIVSDSNAKIGNDFLRRDLMK